MKRLALLLALLAAPLAWPHVSWAQGTTIRLAMQIWAGPLHREYLGCLNCDALDVSSVWDTYGAMGWENDFAANSHYARYRAAHGRYSACDAFAADPPILIDNSRRSYGVLNVSETRTDSICGRNGSPGICQVLKSTCARADQ